MPQLVRARKSPRAARPLPHAALALLLATAAPVLLWGQPASPQPASPQPANTLPGVGSGVTRLTPEAITAAAKEAEESADLEPEAKTKASTLYQQAAEALQAESGAASRLAEFTETEQTAARELAKAKADLLALESAPPPSYEGQELDAVLVAKEQDLEAERAKRALLEAEPRRRAARRANIPAEMVNTRQEIALAEQALAAQGSSSEPPAVIKAEETRLKARLQWLRTELAALERELAAYAVTGPLISAQLDLSVARVNQLTTEITALRQAITQRQKAEADRKVREALRLKASQENAAVQQLVQQYAELAEEAKRLADEGRISQERLDSVTSDLETLNRRYTRTKGRVQAGGLTDAIGLLLRKELVELPDADDWLRKDRQLQPRLRATQLRLLELQDRRSDLADLAAEAEAIVAAAPASSALDREALSAAVRDILLMERSLLDDLAREYDAQFDRLVRLSERRDELVETIEEYEQFINERILWIISAPPSDIGNWVSVRSTLRWLFLRTRWQQLANQLAADIRGHGVLYFLFLAALLALLRLQHVGRRQVRNLGVRVMDNPVEPLSTSIAALGLTLLISAPLPAVLSFFAWRLNALQDDGLPEALSVGLGAAAAVALLIDFVRHLCRPYGLAEAHFRVPDRSAAAIRGAGRQALVVFVPLSLGLWAIEAMTARAGSNPISRLLMIAATLALVRMIHRLLGPRGPVVQDAVEYHPHGWLRRFHGPIRWAALAVPLGLMAGSLAGYHYTSLRLLEVFKWTMLLLLVVLLSYSLVVRLLRVSRARIILDQPPAAQPSGEQAPDAPPLEDQIEASTQQSRKLLAAVTLTVFVVGLWQIWVDVLPALGVMREVELWNTTAKISQTVTGVDGQTRVETVDQVQPVTLADLGMALVAVVLTVLALRDVPGLVEISVLRQIPLDTGVRYAITTVVRWLIALLGVVVAAAFLGLTWSKVQWLAAAVTIGLGFGLQEIFANFVSGIVLLFERPIRVGDIITVGTTTGVVTRVQARGTTIRNWDRQELIVPNKDLMTGQLLNWTLSDRVNRIVLVVGIAYGSDIRKAVDLIRSMLNSHPNVLVDPPAQITFEEFADSTLNIRIRAFLMSLEQRLPTIHDLNIAIHDTFASEGIEIAFPQRDIRIRSDGEIHSPGEQEMQ